MDPTVERADRFADLRRTVAAIEGRTIGFEAPPERPAEAALAFGVEAIDRRLGPVGGLALGVLHEATCEAVREIGALTGFAAALLARLAERRAGRILWIAGARGRGEGGRLAAEGLLAFGLDPGRLVEATVERPEEALWAFEEGLACPGTAAVVAEIPDAPACLDLTATRRLALRAARDAAAPLALLLRPAGRAQTTAAATRWRVAASPSRSLAFAPGLGRAAFRLDLEKNRDGRLGRFDLEWDAHARRFALLPTPAVAAPAPSADRPAPAPSGRVLAFERGGNRRGER